MIYLNKRHYFCIVLNLQPPLITAMFFIKNTGNSTAVIAKERETLKTLSYDCGNPVIICLRAFARSAFLLFYLLDRHAPLAMTKGTKCLILHSLTTPSQPPTRHVARGPVSCHPSNGGELTPQREIRVTSNESRITNRGFRPVLHNLALGWIKC